MKQPTEMTNKELLESYRVGSQWLTDKMQVSYTNKTQDGNIYDHKNWVLGLHRLEIIETELLRRKIPYDIF